MQGREVKTQKFYLEAVNVGKRSVSLYQVPAAMNDPKRRLPPERVATLRGWQLRIAQNAIASALKRSNRKVAVLSTRPKSKMSIMEEDGIRLGLIFRGLKDLKDVSKAHEFVTGVHSMSREEAYYWFAKVQNGSPSRGVRALRVLLAGVR
jgi:DNA-directed RNA polymerase specialized sigma24 family protein